MGVREQIVHLGLFGCAFLTILTTGAILVILSTESFLFFSAPEVSVLEFFTGTRWAPNNINQSFGVLSLVVATLMIAMIAALVGLPIGIGSAIYLSEYAKPGTRNLIKPILEILAGIPSIVYGYFAIVFITPYLLRPAFGLIGIQVGIFNSLSAGITVGIMIIPTVASLSEGVLRAVPMGLRDAGYALGATKFEVCTKIVVPAALSGIMAAFLLAISRAVGETMAVAIAAGNNPQFTLNPLLENQTMTAYIASKSQGESSYGSIEYRSLYAVGLVLFLITLAMNLMAQFILKRFRNIYQ